MSFVHLHVHSEYSLLDGLPKIKRLVNYVKELGMNACAITDHGNMHGAIEFYKACQKTGIRPIIGTETYLCSDSRLEKNSRNRKNYHLLLLAKNQQGYQNLMKLVSLGHLEGFYYKPRIDWELLEKYHHGLICTSACLQGEISSYILEEQSEKAKQVAARYQQLFEEDYYLEIQRHPGLPDFDTANKQIVKISRELGIPLVATNDTHYLHQEDAFAQDVLLMINTQTTVNSQNRLSMAGTPDFYLKGPEQMIQNFSDLPDAVANTTKIADKCSLEIELGKWYFPNFKLPSDETAESYLTKLVIQKTKEYYVDVTTEIQQRLDYELGVICPKGYAPYFLIMRDFIDWCEHNNTATNTRGSASGSLVSFVLGITSVDPLIYQLPFERFLNKDRPSPPDIDLDVADDKRQQMLHQIVNEYGRDSVAQICTFGRMMAKAAVRDTARVLGYEYAVGDRISKLIPEGSQGFPMTIDKALNTAPDLKNLYRTDPDAKKILDTARQIEGCARHLSVHACGLVISPTTINDFCPSQLETGGDKIITQYEFHAIEDVGLIKFDILGIDNLSFLGQAVLNVKKTKSVEVNLRKIPLNDQKTFRMLSAGHTMGVFQLSSEGMTKWLRELKPNRVEDLMAMVALYRPGPMSIIPEYIARKNNPSKISYIDPKMEKFLSKSYGLLVYQDDCLYTAIELAGYNWVEVDKFRKAIGKKIPEEMAAQKEKFVQGCINNGYTKDKAEQIFSFIEPFTSYGFNKAHAASYGMLAYRTAYMKANFPVEYMCALLSSKADDSEKVSAGIEECRKMGIIVSPPDINHSHRNFEIEKNENSLEGLSLCIGLSAVKNVGEAAIEAILSEREKNGPFYNFNDFCLRVNGQKVNKKVLESLIKVGAFDAFGERNAILSALNTIRNQCDKSTAQKNSGQFGLFDHVGSNQKTAPPKDGFPEVAPMSEKEKLAQEKLLLGIFVTQNPISKMLENFQLIHLPKINQILEKGDHATVKIVAIVTKIKTIRTKKDNSPMAFITLEDETGNIETVAFPRTYQAAASFLSENKPVYIEGKISFRNDSRSIILDLISEDTPDSTPKYDFVVEVPKDTPPSKLMELNSLLKNNPDGYRGLIILPNGKHLPLAYGVNYTPSLQKQIDTILKIT